VLEFRGIQDSGQEIPIYTCVVYGIPKRDVFFVVKSPHAIGGGGSITTEFCFMLT